MNYNRGYLVKESVEIFAKYKTIDKIVIVDNVSSDNSIDILRQIDNPKIDVFIQNHNLGYARGNNVGLRYLFEQLHYDYAFIVNPDVFFTEEVINRIINALDNNPQYAVITSARIDPDSKNPNLQYCRSYYGTYSQMILSILNITRHYYLQPKYGVYDFDINNHEVQEICLSPGSFFGVRLNIMKEVGYLDEGTFLYGEERCLAKRIEMKGYKEGFVSDVVYEHRHIRNSTTTNDISLRSHKFMLDSQYYYAMKYLNIGVLRFKFLKIVGCIFLFEMYIINLLKSKYRK